MEKIPGWVEIKLGLFEVVLEIVMANNLASVRQDESAQFKKDLLDLIVGKIRLPPGSGSVDVEDLHRAQEQMIVEFQVFLQKVADREESLRKRISSPTNQPQSKFIRKAYSGKLRP